MHEGSRWWWIEGENVTTVSVLVLAAATETADMEDENQYHAVNTQEYLGED